MSKEQQYPLEGVKVVDFGWLGVEPITMKYLADWGATVVRVESHARPDNTRMIRPYKDNKPGPDRAAFFTMFNSSKYSVSLNLSKPEGVEVAKRLIKWADIVGEGFTPRVMRGWGVDYETARQIKPDIIYFSTSNQGADGPNANQPGMGLQSTALAGAYHLTGWPDRGPVQTAGAYTDMVSPRFSAFTVLAAFDYHRRTGRGLYIDQSQFESSLHFFAPVLMDFSVNGRVQGRNGNRLDYTAPHGVYRCRGEDSWCAISVFNDKQWQAFVQAIGAPEWAGEPRFSTLLARKANEDELDKLIEVWTSNYTAGQVMTAMQAAGIAAGVVNSTRDLFTDPQLQHRGYFRYLEHSVIGPHAYDGPSFRISGASDRQFAAPALGQHTDFVLTQLLGMSEEDVNRLILEGVVTTEADLPELRSGV